MPLYHSHKLYYCHMNAPSIPSEYFDNPIHLRMNSFLIWNSHA